MITSSSINPIMAREKNMKSDKRSQPWFQPQSWTLHVKKAELDSCDFDKNSFTIREKAAKNLGEATRGRAMRWLPSWDFVVVSSESSFIYPSLKMYHWGKTKHFLLLRWQKKEIAKTESLLPNEGMESVQIGPETWCKTYNHRFSNGGLPKCWIINVIFAQSLICAFAVLVKKGKSASLQQSLEVQTFPGDYRASKPAAVLLGRI